MVGESVQRWTKVLTPLMLSVLMFHSCSNLLVFYAFFFKVFAFVSAFFGLFASFLNNFDYFLHIFYVQTFLAQSCVSAIFLAFSISG